MACLVSTTLSLPLSASHSSTMEMRPRNLSLLVRLPCQPISEAAAKPSASSSTNKAIPSSNRSCQDHLRTPSKPLLKIMSCYRNVYSCSLTIIFGLVIVLDLILMMDGAMWKLLLIQSLEYFSIFHVFSPYVLGYFIDSFKKHFLCVLTTSNLSMKTRKNCSNFNM